MSRMSTGLDPAATQDAAIYAIDAIASTVSEIPVAATDAADVAPAPFAGLSKGVTDIPLTDDVTALPEAIRLAADQADGSSLFSYQQMVFKYMEQTAARGVLLYHAVGSGKCMAENTPVLLSSGEIAKIQDVRPGDELAGDDLTGRRVLTTTAGVDNMYNVWYGKYKYTVNEAHILCLRASKAKRLPMSYMLPADPATPHPVSRLVFTYQAKLYFRDFKRDPATPDHPGFMERELVDWSRRQSAACSDGGQVVEISVEDYLQLPEPIRKSLRGYKAVARFTNSSGNADAAVPPTLPTDESKEYYAQFSRGSLATRRQFIRTAFNQQGKPLLSQGGGAYLILPMNHKHFADALVFACNSSGVLVDCSITWLARPVTAYRDPHPSVCYYKVKVFGQEVASLGLRADLCAAQPAGCAQRVHSFYDGVCVKVKFSHRGRYYGFTIDGNQRYLLGDCTVTHNTMTSIAIAEMFRQKGRRAVVLSAKSLQINYQKEIDAFAERTGHPEGSSLKTHYEMITSNSRTLVDRLQGVPPPGKSKRKAMPHDHADSVLGEVMATFKSLEGCVMVVDEAHNLFNSIANGSETANKFYDLVMSTADIRLVFLTGTPLVNDPFEMAIAMNMLKGTVLAPGDRRRPGSQGSRGQVGRTVLPEHFEDFYKYFVDGEKNCPANPIKLKSRIFGMVSYYGPLLSSKVDSLSAELKKTIVKQHYPDRLPLVWEVVKMSGQQCSAYMLAREKERLENVKKGSGIQKDKSTSSTSYRIRSRILSNVYAEGKTPEEQSPKIAKLVSNILMATTEGIHVVYSTFLDSGLKYVANLLETQGEYSMWQAEDAQPADAPRMAIFSGQQSMEEKQAILQLVTSPENIRGAKLKVLLISKSGTEGLDLKNVRYVHILEPYWNFSLIQQIIARGVRYRSHEALPEADRNVQTIMYLSDYNAETLKELKQKHADQKAKGRKPFDLEKTTDIHMMHNAIRQQELIDKFLRIMAEASIECANLIDTSVSDLQCFTCRPDRRPLYTPLLEEDMLTAPTCSNAQSTQAEMVLVNGEELYMANGTFYREDGAGKFAKVDDEEAAWIRASM